MRRLQVRYHGATGPVVVVRAGVRGAEGDMGTAGETVGGTRQKVSAE